MGKPRELLRLEGELATARRNEEQVQVTNKAELAQADAQLWEAREGEARERASSAVSFARASGLCAMQAQRRES